MLDFHLKNACRADTGKSFINMQLGLGVRAERREYNIPQNNIIAFDIDLSTLH